MIELVLAALTLVADYPLVNVAGLTPQGLAIEAATHKGKAGVRVTGPSGNDDAFVTVDGSQFTNGTLEVEVSGEPAPGAGGGARGFVGLAFHVSGADTYDAFYIRPTNGRADDQLRRNHSTQYISHPDWTWSRLRKDQPGVYESYVDLQPGEWTKLRITVDGKKARLYVDAASEPVLIVNDLKLAGSAGAVALWVGPGCIAYFRDLRVRP